MLQSSAQVTGGARRLPGDELTVGVLAESRPGGFYALDAAWCLTHVNSSAARVLGRPAGELLGRVLWDVLPEATGAALRAHFEAAVQEQRPVAFHAVGAAGRSCAVRARPAAGGLAVFIGEEGAAETPEPATGPGPPEPAAHAETILRETAAAIAAGPTARELHGLACDAALALVRATSGWACRFEGEGLRIVAQAGVQLQAMAGVGELRSVPPGGELARVRETGEPLAVPALREGGLHQLGFRSATWIPVRAQGEPWGVLCVAGRAADERTSADLPVLCRLADLLEPALTVEAPAVRALSAPWQGTLDSLTGRMAVLDPHGAILAINSSWQRFATDRGDDGSPFPHLRVGDDYLGACDAAALRGDVAAAALAGELRALLAGERDDVELRAAAPGPGPGVTVRASLLAEAGVRNVLVQHEDSAGEQRAEAPVARPGPVLDEGDAAVVCTDLDGIVTLWNDAAERLWGWSAAEALGRPTTDLGLEHRTPEDTAELLTALERDGSWQGERGVSARDGRRFTCAMRTSLVRDAAGASTGTLTVSVDVSSREQHRRNIEAARDYLFAVTASITDGLLALNPDGTVIYGNEAAARALRRSMAGIVGHPLAAVIGRPGEELPELLSDAAIVRAETDEFIRADGERFPVSWTSSALEGGPYGEGRVVVFRDTTAEQHERRRRRREADRLRAAARIRDAVRHERFTLHAQPIVALADGRVSHHELLLRLRDEDGELLSPAAFLPQAEEHGLMRLVDRWVLEAGMGHAAAGMRVQLNVSGQSVGDPGLVDELEHGLERHGICAQDVTLELTETALSADLAAAVRFTHAASALGFRIALDDFGTGWNGFTNLKHLAVDELKIDLQFVQDLLHAPASHAVVEAVVSLAQGLGIVTVAEGVEDAGTLERLRALGVDFAQGYHLGRPGPIDELPEPGSALPA